MQIPRLIGFIPFGPKGLKNKRSQRVADLRAEDARIQAERHARLTGRRKQQIKHTTRPRPPLSVKPAALQPFKTSQSTPLARTPHTPAPVAITPQSKPTHIVTVAPTPVATAPAPVVARVAAAPNPISTEVSAPSRGRGSYANAFSERGRSYMSMQTSRSQA